MPDAEEVEGLITELAEAKREYARAYLHARQGPPLGGRSPTVDDAHMGARVNLESRGIQDPEILRLRLYAILRVGEVARID